MKTTTDMTGIAVEKSWSGVYFAFVNGKMLRTPVKLIARNFKTPEEAVKAALAAKAVAS